MSEENNILDAVDYILISLNNIKNYNHFIEYKEEFIKALLDIKKYITNLMNNKNNLKNLNNIQENQSILDSTKDKDNASYLSSMLGLKFNYDPYFDENQLKNLTENEKSIKNYNYIKINNNNKNNISYNQSIRNKFMSYNKNGQDNINRNSDRVNQNNTFNNISPIKPKTNKEKLSLIADIVLKMNSEDYIYEILTKLYGEDLTDKLMSNTVSEELLESIQNSIIEIESINKKDPIKKNNENREKKIFDNKFNMKYKNNYKRSISSKKFNIDKKKNNIYKEFNFVKSLRKNGKKSNLENNDNKTIYKKNKNKKEKPFINATNPYGKYFDTPLQNGGLSKLKKPY